MVLGLGFSVAAYMCFLAAKPIDFYPPGNHPQQWYSSLGLPLNEAKGKEVENYQEMIDDNDTSLQASAGWLNRGVKVAIASPVAALISLWLAISFS